MVVMPVSRLDSATRFSSNMSFVGKGNKNDNDTEGFVSNDVKGSNKLSKVPVIVLMAMAPGMLNADMPKEGLPTQHGEPIEMYIPSEASGYMSIPAEAVTDKAPVKTKAPMGLNLLKDSKIQKVLSYTDKGQKKNVVFATSKSETQNVVDNVYMIPQGIDESKLLQLPYVSKIIYHDLGEDKEFCGVEVVTQYRMDPKTGEFPVQYKEERIPDDVANEILSLITGDAQWRNRTFIDFDETKSASLLPTKTVRR